MNQPPLAAPTASTWPYPSLPEQIGQPDPLSAAYLGTYSPPPAYLTRPDLAERYRPGDVAIACACGGLHDPGEQLVDPCASLMSRWGMAVLHYLRRVAA